MTIYKGKAVDEKKLTKKLDSPSVVLTADIAFVPLTQPEFDKGEESFHSPEIKVLRRHAQNSERRFMRICAVLAVLTILAFATCLGYFARHKLISSKPFVGTLHVRFHDYHRTADEPYLPESRINGGFFEQVEVDWKTNQYEKINVPPFIEVRSATVVHDFVQMWTAIVDHDDSHCFVTPLNRSITFPPETFMEYIKDQQKIGIKYGATSFSVERHVHKVITPPQESLLEYGVHIASACHFYDTYLLVKADKPVAMSKRFACQFSGKTYSLGGTGYPILVLVALEGCM